MCYNSYNTVQEYHMNQKHETWINPKVEIRSSSIQGKGMFSLSDIPVGEKILLWGGESYTDSNGAREALKQGKFVMQWDDDIFSFEIDGEVEEPYTINHCCDPNTWMIDAYTLVARRNVIQGEEITADYAFWDNDISPNSSWLCNCGSEICRGKVTGNDWNLKELQQRYKGHFSPLVNKLIDSQNQCNPL